MRKGTTGNLGRREFLQLLAVVGATTALSPALVSCSSADYVDEATAIRAVPFTKEPTISVQSRELIRYTILAPSGHNTQPWKFSINGNIVRIFPDYSRRLPARDPDDRELFISLGCALENLVVSARYAAINPEIDYSHGRRGIYCHSTEGIVRKTQRDPFQGNSRPSVHPK